jgi:hypothetical protein
MVLVIVNALMPSSLLSHKGAKNMPYLSYFTLLGIYASPAKNLGEGIEL